MSIVSAQPLSVWRTGSLRVNTDLVGLDIEGKAKGAQSLHSLLDDQDYELMGGYTFGRSLSAMSSTTTCDDAALCGDAADVCEEALCGDGSDGACEAALCGGADNCDAALCGGEFPEDECDDGLCQISLPSCVDRAQCPDEPTTCAGAQLYFATGGCAASCTNTDFVSVVGTLVPLYPALAGCTRQAPIIVTTAFTASGDVSDFTPSKKEGIKTVFATAARVDPSVVTVTVTSASVLITVAIAFSSPAAATTAVSTLSTGILANQGSLAAALQAAVPSIVVQAIVTAPVITSGPGTAIAPLTPPSADNTNTIIIAVVVSCSVVICFVIGLAFYHRRKQGERPRKKGAGVSSGAEMQSIQLKEKYKPIPMGQISYGDQLGTGAFGVVYKCTFQATKCAIKKLHAKDESSEALAKALMDEFHVMSQLRHPNVLLTLGIAEDAVEGTKGIVMELMEASLADVINLAAFELYSSWEGSFFSIASDAANGMAYIHFNSMLHRDLKPGNVLLDAQWVAKIADFGSTFNSAANQAGKDGGDIQGTPPYMAPEIVQNKVYDTPADVWAFGCLLAHMGSKRAPYSWLTHIETPKQLIEVVRGGKYSPLELLLESKTTPDGIKDLAEKCCQRGPNLRPNFEQISGMITAAIPEGVEPRPVARIKNRRPLRTGLPMASGPTRDAASSETGRESKFRDRFKSKALEKSYRNNATGAGVANVGDDVSKPSLFDTFSDTLLATFTPGKIDNEEDKTGLV